MQPSEDDLESLWDMRKAIQRIQSFTTGASETDYLANVMLQSAVERQLEILGEAAKRVSINFQREHPEVDWRNTIGLRNVIAHQYERVEQDKIWRIVQTVLPDFLVLVETFLPPIED
ncbi:MAG: HepT-like ribonuclease domain-containing protein [Synechococcales bacterium]|nr:HepT-like ribonuclease domain-containing protein [Synechococcales bacterium]